MATENGGQYQLLSPGESCRHPDPNPVNCACGGLSLNSEWLKSPEFLHCLTYYTVWVLNTHLFY
jgi:hypothetical protein